MKKILFFSAILCALAMNAQTPIYIYKDGKVIFQSDETPDSIVFYAPIDPIIDDGGKSFLPPEEYMNIVRSTITGNVPSSATNTNDGGRIQSITYFSKKANKNKKADVLLPKNYDDSKKYPVLYVNHGIMGDEKSMQSNDFKINSLLTNLMDSGEAKEMIIVYTAMYTNPNKDACSGINAEECTYYDDFLYDIAESLMPYINEHFPTLTDREHTAISGFSMGGRESLYIGLMRPDLFGYIGCASPAPGVTPGSDMFMTHPGNMQKSELKFKDGDPLPYVFLIVGGTNDQIVGTFPKEYHETLTSNHVDHLWLEIPGGGHDQSCIIPMYYNFIRSIFKEADELK